LEAIEGTLKKYEIRVVTASVEKDLDKGEIFLRLEIKLNSRTLALQALEGIAATPGVRKVRID
jgi:hypothetical protein